MNDTSSEVNPPFAPDATAVITPSITLESTPDPTHLTSSHFTPIHTATSPIDSVSSEFAPTLTEVLETASPQPATSQSTPPVTELIDTTIEFASSTSEFVAPTLEFASSATESVAPTLTIDFASPTTELLEPTIEFASPATDLLEPTIDFAPPTAQQRTEAPTESAPPPTATPEIISTPEPSPVIDSELITWDELTNRLDSVNDNLRQHLDDTTALVSSLNSDFEALVSSFESEVDIYCSAVSEPQTSVLSFFKFRSHLKEVSLPKGLSGLWESEWDGATSTAFQFRTAGGRIEIAEKLSFRDVAKRDCAAKDFFVTLQTGANREIATRVYQLEAWKNVTLPFPIKFETLRIVALSNHGNSTAMCLPEFRVYRRLGFGK